MYNESFLDKTNVPQVLIWKLLFTINILQVDKHYFKRNVHLVK